MTVFRRFTCTHHPDQRRRREREKRKMSSMQWNAQKVAFVLLLHNHSGISDTVPQIGSFCVLKKRVHSRIGQCVRPSVRLHDNSSQLHSIELKFCAQNCLINILVELKDEKDPSRNG